MRSGFMLLAASLAVVAVAALGGCKKSGDDASARMAAFRDKMCGCKDKACIDQVTADMAKWSADHRGDTPEKTSEADQKKIAAISEEITKCMTQVARSAAPAAGSAGSGSAGSAAAADGSGAQGSGAAAGSGADSAAGGASAGD